MRSRAASLLLLTGVCVVAVAACGKKGAPLAPIVRLPASAQQVTASRVGRDVYVAFSLPTTNVDRSTPVDLGYVEVYALTAPTAPRTGFLEMATRVARVPVSAQTPVASPRPSGGAEVAPLGSSMSIRDTITETAAPGARRFYLILPFSTRDRPGAQHTPVGVSIEEAPRPPMGVQVTYTATAVTVGWVPRLPVPVPAPVTPTPGVVTNVAPAVAQAPAPAVASPLAPADGPVAEPPPLRVNVYRDVAVQPSGATATIAERPRPLHTSPLAAPPFTDNTPTFGVEVCYRLRTVVGDGTSAIEGEASDRVCVTPIDHFAPAAPTQLAAIATTGAINLLWEANTEADLAGYVVLRGVAGDERLQAVTPAPIVETRFVDTTVVPGTRYVYAVLAVDRQRPTPNASPESLRVEETAQ